ncbi:MerR family transcriptional regulator [Enterococcus asini]|uniref:MerR family transcriptional regulator n=1 Tax=Enterococcus asini TaxID=57732 RepID=UPI0032E41CEE
MNIKEVSEKYEIPADTLRYWERIGAIPPVQRSASGHRDYDEEDQQWVYWTNCTRKAGVSLERIVEYIDLFKAGDQTIPTRKALLKEQLAVIKEHLAEIQKMYNALDEKITHYEEHMVEYEGKLKIRKGETLK